ncbi:alpha-amylase/4-alpha-glucanotransferase domain-containing protein [Candidatus Omnitrophota bacterium]
MINFLIAIHCHQPVGNFDGVIQEAYEKSYLPFITVLERHPKVKLSLHYSGNLIDWFKSNQPEFLTRIKKLVDASQVEIIAGGYFEPILSMIPERDAWGQIKMLKNKIKDEFSYSAQGAWLAERIWEPKIPSILSQAGITYTMVDDSHFSAVSELTDNGKFVKFQPKELNGYYLTEELGNRLCIFPGSEKLRYLMPFKLPQETIDYLKERSQRKTNPTITFADDGEKFGLWPGTHKWVYQEKWLDTFFTCLEANREWINLTTFSEHLKHSTPTGRIYLSCASYREMLEWSGGFFRNFLVKYPEANSLHKKMIYVSNKIAQTQSACSNGKKCKVSKKTIAKELTKARHHLYMGQANDIYWHGVFGGLYLNHLRLAISRHLVEAEKIVDRILRDKTKQTVEVVDYDCDGNDEVIVNTEKMNMIIKPAQGAALSSWDYRETPATLINTLVRRYEPYHDKLTKKPSQQPAAGKQPASIHDAAPIKQDNLKQMLFYDKHNRYCLQDHFLDPSVHLEDFIKSSYVERLDFIGMPFETHVTQAKKKCRVAFSRRCGSGVLAVGLKKTIEIEKSCANVHYAIKNLGQNDFSARFGIEFNLSVYDSVLAVPGETLSMHNVNINDVWNKLQIAFTAEQPFNLWHFPIETVSQTETGIDKTYQNLCLLLWWDITVEKNKTWDSRILIDINT